MSIFSPVKSLVSDWLYRRESDFTDRLIIKLSQLPWYDEMVGQQYPWYENNENRQLLLAFIDYLEETISDFEKIDHIESTSWTSETCALETARCLLSPNRYRPPLRKIYGLKAPWFNSIPLLHVFGYAYRKAKMHRSLSSVSALSDKLFICEAGRGLELLMANTIKDWSRISCYDHNPIQRQSLLQHFGSQIDCFDANSLTFDFSSISEETILIADQHNIPESGIKAIQQNEHIAAAIIDGDITKS